MAKKATAKAQTENEKTKTKAEESNTSESKEKQILKEISDAQKSVETLQKTIEKETKKESKAKKKDLPKIEYESLKSSSKNIAIQSLMTFIKNNRWDMNHPVQRRSNQWSIQAKSKFLHSLVIGIICPEIVLCTHESHIWVIDGKQRLSCLNEYINKKDTKLTLFGRKFDELEDNIKDIILSANINVITYEDLTDKQVFMIFERMNNGVALSGSQKSRSYATIRILSEVQEILNSHFIREICNLTTGQQLKDEGFNVVIQAAMLISNWNFKNFSSKEIDRFLQENTEQDILNTLSIVKNNIKILDEIVKEKNKNLKKIHLPMVIAGVSDNPEYRTKLFMLLNKYDEMEEYRQYCQGSTSQKQNVEKRWEFFNV